MHLKLIWVKYFLHFTFWIKLATDFPVTESIGTEADESLVQVQLVFRHGLRSPSRPYPGDPYSNESYWPQGWGSLTNEGKREQLRLGKFIRSRYKSLILKGYQAADVIALSSDLDRTIMSALANLAGLFPPSDQDLWSQEIPTWQPVPVRTIPSNEDRIIRGYVPCPNLDKYWNNFLRTNPEVQTFNRDYQDLYSYISSFTGEEYRYPVNLTTFYEALIIQHAHGMTLPNWTQVIYPSELSTNLLSFAFKLVVYDDFMVRLQAGPLFTEVVKNMENFISGNKNGRKMILFSGHDMTLVRILAAVDAFSSNPHLPEFNSLFMMELHRASNGSASEVDHFVKIFYRRGEGQVDEISIKNCSNPCSLHELKKAFQNRLITVDQWEKECRPVEGLLQRALSYNLQLEQGVFFLSMV